jgi:hypothetical protein
MPLKSGPDSVPANMHELKSGPHHKKMAAKYGAKKAHEIDVAIAMRKAHGKNQGAMKPRGA